jgi:hypothetical protein
MVNHPLRYYGCHGSDKSTCTGHVAPNRNASVEAMTGPLTETRLGSVFSTTFHAGI